LVDSEFDNLFQSGKIGCSVSWGDKNKFYQGKLIRDTHFLWLGLEIINGESLTIVRWQKIHPKAGEPNFYFYPPDCWYEAENFAGQAVCRPQWHLSLVDIVPGSTSKWHDDQKKMLPDGYEVPSAIEEVTKDILFYRRRGVWPNSKVYACVSGLTADGRRVFVGYGGFGGLNVDRWNGEPYADVGLSASQQSPRYFGIKKRSLI